MNRCVAVVLTVAIVLASCDSSGRPDATELAPPTFEVITQLAAPGSTLTIEVGLVDGDTAGYRVVHGTGADERDVIAPSLLGLATSHGSLLDGLVVADAGAPIEWSSAFDLPTGKRRSSTLDGVQQTVRFDGNGPLALEVDLVATDDAVALRQRAIGTGTDPTTIDFERFELAYASTSQGWMQPHDRADRFRPAYERLRSSARPVDALPASTEGWNFPMLTEHDGVWTLVTEAGLGRGMTASHVRGNTADGSFFLTYPSENEGNGVGRSAPTGDLPITMPWRVVVASDDLGDVVETDIVRHLSEPNPDPERDFSWVEPGRVSWSWWSDPDSPKEPERLIDFIELSATLDWEYSLIDANWNELTEDDFVEVVDAADQVGVGLFLWYNSGGPTNTVTEAPRDRMAERSVRRDEMERIADLGVRGIKVDFFQSDKPATIDQYLDILADAADFELLVNFHGSTLPRGWSRTWPNLMTMEAVPGAEQYIFNPAYAAQAPSHNTLLAFTRNVVGPMDYTPTMLGNTRLHRTTDVHELALAVVYESGLTHFVDTPGAYLDQPAAILTVLRDVPVAWDDIVLLDGGPASHAVIARRSGDEWWVGAINGTDEPLRVEVSEQLAELGAVTLRICDDGSGGSGPLEMGPAGGCVLRLDAG